MRFFLLITICCVLAACSTPSKLAKKCAELFPVQDSVLVKTRTITDTLIIPFYDVKYVDTTECPPSEVPVLLIDTIVRKVPGRKIPYQVLVHDTILIRKDSALVRKLQDEITATKRRLTVAHTKLQKRWPLWITILAILLAMLAGIGLKSLFRFRFS